MTVARRRVSVAGDPGTRMPAYGLLNGRLGVGALDGRMRVGIYRRNLGDQLFIARLRPLPFGPTGSYLQTVAGEGRRTSDAGYGVNAPCRCARRRGADRTAPHIWSRRRGTRTAR